MHQEIIPVVLSFTLYAFYVLLPMIPAVVIYKMFPDTKVSANGILGQLNFKTTGAFAAYVVTVFIGFFLVQSTNRLIFQMSKPAWTLNTKVKLLNYDGSPYRDKNLLETMVVSIQPEIQRVSGDDATISIPYSKEQWQMTSLKFDIPHFGYTTVKVNEITQHATIDDLGLIVTLHDPVTITADKQVTNDYQANYANTLTPDSTSVQKHNQ